MFPPFSWIDINNYSPTKGLVQKQDKKSFFPYIFASWYLNTISSFLIFKKVSIALFSALKILHKNTEEVNDITESSGDLSEDLSEELYRRMVRAQNSRAELHKT